MGGLERPGERRTLEGELITRRASRLSCRRLLSSGGGETLTSVGRQELLPLLSEAVAATLMCSLGVSRELVCPEGKLHFVDVQLASAGGAPPLWLVAVLFDIRQLGAVVGGDPVAALEVKVEEGAGQLGHKGETLDAIRVEQAVDGFAKTGGACTLFAAELVFLNRSRHLRRSKYARRGKEQSRGRQLRLNLKGRVN